MRNEKITPLYERSGNNSSAILAIHAAPSLNMTAFYNFHNRLYNTGNIESNGEGATKWGRLKSGVGWIGLDF